MRIAIIGQQAFGKSVFEAFLARGDEVAGVFCAPEKPGARPDPLRQAAEAAKSPPRPPFARHSGSSPAVA
jgi:methionyl-tRNA formyltransferase